MLTIEYWQATCLALIQGLTEFLPISSSAHLLLPSSLLGWDDQGLAFDVAVHLGTLLAVILYFRTDLLEMTAAWTRSALRGEHSQQSRLAWLLILATLPVIVAGFLLQEVVDTYLRNTVVIAMTTIIFALVLWIADRTSSRRNTLEGVGWRSALFIGCAQILALIPGTSRSGITMSAALLCHLDREAAGRFSFLLSIPVIAGAGLLLTLDLLEQGQVDWWLLCYAAVVSGLVAYACIHYFLKLITRIGFMPFIIYRLLLGLLLIVLAVM